MFLKILCSEDIDVPLSAKGLLKDGKVTTLTRSVSPGQYTHLEILPYLEHIEGNLKDHMDVVSDVNVDGLPLYKASTTSSWPILGFF